MTRHRKAANSVPPRPAVDALTRRRLPILLRHAWFSLNQTFRRRMAHTGVTPGQFTALRNLMEHEPHGLTQSGLTRLIGSDPNTIAALVERLEGMGWIARLRHERDRRAYRLRLLPAGRQTYERVRQIATVLQTEVLADWTEKKREQFLEDLAYVAERCRLASAGKGKKKGNS